MQQASSQEQVWLIGIDDTDNLDTRGTGYRARCLLAALDEAALADPLGVTRHQLLVDPRIPYTSHNSSACLQVRTSRALADIFAFCRAFLLDVAAPGSDVGLCVASSAQGAALADFGQRAKRDVLNQAAAHAAAAATGVRYEGLTGTRDGIIGSMAAVGLYADGNDGRYLWKRGLREMTGTVVRVDELAAKTGIDDIRRDGGASILDQRTARIALGQWPRPVRIDGLAVLLVTEGTAHEFADYECIDKQQLKAFRP